MKSFLLLGFTILFFVACSSTDVTKEQDIELKKITDLEDEIIALAASSICNDAPECTAIAFGSKPCGGPWSYLVYGTSIDVNLLTSKVATFNQMQQEFNIKYSIASDCAFVGPPNEIICEDGKCKIVL